VVLALLHGGLAAIGHDIVQRSQVVQREIEVIQHKIEDWITKRLHSDEKAAVEVEDLMKL